MAWGGLKTNMTPVTGDLVLDAGAQEGSYVSWDGSTNNYIDTGVEGDYRINLQFDAKESPPVSTDETNEIEIKLEIDTSQETGGAPSWDGWRPFLPGQFHCRFYRLRATAICEDAYGNRPKFTRFEESHTMVGSEPRPASVDDTATVPTGTEELGQRYIIISPATGAFVGLEDQIADLADTTDRIWRYFIPVDGQKVKNLADGWYWIYEGSYPSGAWHPRGKDASNPVKDEFVGAMEVVGSKSLDWGTDGGGDIGLIGSKRPDEIHAKSRITVNGVDVLAGAHILGGALHTADTLANLNTKISDLIATYGSVRDFGVGTLAQRPGFGTANRFWWATDNQILYRDTGSAWEAVVAVPSAHLLGGASHTADSLANLNSKVTGGNLDFDSASRPPSGSASGDLSSTYPGPTVAKVQGNAVQSGAPTAKDILQWSGSAWDHVQGVAPNYDSGWFQVNYNVLNYVSKTHGIGSQPRQIELFVSATSGGTAYRADYWMWSATGTGRGCTVRDITTTTLRVAVGNDSGAGVLDTLGQGGTRIQLGAGWARVLCWK